MTVIKRLRGAAAVASAVGLGMFTSACSGNEIGALFGEEGDSEPLRIVAATELADLQPVLQEASKDLGFPIEIELPAGTLTNTVSLGDGDFDGQFDATWFATNRYAELSGAVDKIASSEKIASSPVVFGVTPEIAQQLGWSDSQPTWEEITEAVTGEDFSFGMTDPATSNSGFSALAAVTTAYADTGSALTEEDIQRVSPKVKEFFSGQTLTSGSSGWLADTFVDDPDRAEAIVNYESVLHTMAQQGRDIEVVVPADGVISADYPLSTLANPTHEGAETKVKELAEWFGENPQALTDAYLRPADPGAEIPAELADRQVFELPFPGSEAVVSTLQQAYADELRTPGSTAFVLDTSGSMEGYRLEQLRDTMDDLIENTAMSDTGAKVGIRENENVSLVPFASDVGPVTEVTVDSRSGGNRSELLDAVDDLTAGGKTALYTALEETYGHIDTGEGSIPSIVLMSDGEATKGMSYETFAEFHGQLPKEQKDIPIFVILYGEASEEEMYGLAELSGGKVFDALGGDLAEAFKEIRGYQ